MELLVVMTVVALLAFLAVPAVQSLGQANRLATAGRLVSNLLTIARSEAINQCTLVQLRVVTTNASPQADASACFRKLSLWKYDPARDAYVQFSRWETLPEGVIFEPRTEPTTLTNPAYAFPASSPAPSNGTYFLNSDASALNNAGTGLSVGKASGYNYTYIEFGPGGNALLPKPASTYAISNSKVYMLLTEGYLMSAAATTPVYSSHGRKSSQPCIANWIHISVSCLTGIARISRP